VVNDQQAKPDDDDGAMLQPVPESAAPTVSESPWALQLAVRVEKASPPMVADICVAAVLATVALLDDDRSQPGGPWFDAVNQWNGKRIRKIVRRGRASAWQRAQAPDGVTVQRGGAEVRAFVPSPMDQAPEALAKLQIQSSPLDEIEPCRMLPAVAGLVIAITPLVEMSWGKQAAQCAHAGQWAWMRSDDQTVDGWNDAGRPVTIVHPDTTLWATLASDAVVQIHDGGFTEIPAGTRTAVAWWADSG